MLLLLLAPATWAQDAANLEKAVKATYLYKIGSFVDWPPQAFPSPSSEVQICVVGDDPFGPLLDRAVEGQRVEDRSVTVRRMRTVDREARCQIMFISGSTAQSIPEAIEATRGTPTLTITDSSRDANTKGIIHFVIRDNRVRFEIDDEIAAQNGLSISSKVLSLAVSVRMRT